MDKYIIIENTDKLTLLKDMTKKYDESYTVVNFQVEGGKYIVLMQWENRGDRPIRIVSKN